MAEVTKDHDFVIKNLVEATLTDYLESIKGIIGADSIVDIGRVTSNYGIWVKDIEAVKKLKALEFITIKNQNVSIGPYVDPLKKVKLIGVPPFVDNTVLKIELNKYGMVKTEIDTEPIYGVPENFKHVKSFNRILHMTFQKDVYLPETITVTHDNTKHAIKTQVGRRKCFFCGSLSHVGSNCIMRKVASYANAVKSQDKTQEFPTKVNDSTNTNAGTFQTSLTKCTELPQGYALTVVNPKKKTRIEAVSATEASQNKKRKKVHLHAIRNIKTRSLHDWRYDEWKNLKLNERKPCKNSKLKEYLQSLPADENKEPMYAITAANAMNKDITQLKTQLFELKQALSPKHVFEKTSLQIIIDQLAVAVQPPINGVS
ncbi:unnamed protein product [Allacma fusca]|uniref:Uncharacterized protein n=1 Tax=Allacma fusca TaxID=39272 RepID=A0A8J2JL86_9HEXA|nr:unnamed protein product [Allacma fusca]